MNKFDIKVILEPNHKKYSGRRCLKMEGIEASCREEAVEKVIGYMKGMLQDYVELIVE